MSNDAFIFDFHCGKLPDWKQNYWMHTVEFAFHPFSFLFFLFRRSIVSQFVINSSRMEPIRCFTASNGSLLLIFWIILRFRAIFHLHFFFFVLFILATRRPTKSHIQIGVFNHEIKMKTKNQTKKMDKLNEKMTTQKKFTK